MIIMMNKKTVVVAGTAVGVVGVGAIAYKLIKMNKLKKQQEQQATTDNEETQEDVTTNETKVPDTTNDTQEEKVTQTNQKDIQKDASKYIASWLRTGSQLYYENDLDRFYNCLLALGLTEDNALLFKNVARTGDYYIENDMRQYLNK